jgi:hypothetical protein
MRDQIEFYLSSQNKVSNKYLTSGWVSEEKSDKNSGIAEEGYV